jgi:hypothetical protein
MNESTLTQDVATVAGDNFEHDTQKGLEDNQSNSDENNPFRVYKTQQEHQEFIDSVIGKRLKDYRELSSRVEEFSPIIESLKNKLGVAEVEQLGECIDTRLNFKKSNDELKTQISTELDTLAQCDQNIGQFNIDELLGNDEFIALINGGVNLNRAIQIANFEKNALAREQEIERQVRENTIENIRAKGIRPFETASRATTSASLSRRVENLTNDEMIEINRRALKGEKIKF